MNTDANNDADLIALLPWYVNGTLEDDERKAVAELLERSEAARKELRALETLSAQVIDEVRANEPVAPVQLGWQRLKRSIAAGNQQSADSGASNVVQGAFPNNRWRSFAAVAAMLIVALQVGILIQRPAEDPNIRLLSGHGLSEHPLQQLGDYHLLQIRFIDTADVAVVNELLQRYEAEIISGPSALGLYQIAVPKRFIVSDVLAWLEHQPAVDHVALETVE